MNGNEYKLWGYEFDLNKDGILDIIMTEFHEKLKLLTEDKNQDQLELNPMEDSV